MPKKKKETYMDITIHDIPGSLVKEFLKDLVKPQLMKQLKKGKLVVLSRKELEGWSQKLDTVEEKLERIGKIATGEEEKKE